MSSPIRILLSSFLTMAILAALLQIPAGRWDWWAGWVCWLVNLAIILLGGILLYVRNPELLRRRSQVGENTQLWDKGMVAALIMTYCMQFAVAGLDVGRSNGGPGPIMFWAGVLCTWLGFFGMLRCMLVNTHFESTVRLQTDRQHKLVDRGPYALVRHPGYSTGLLYFLGLGLMLGSWWALCLWPIETAILSARLVLEEDFLSEALEGYADYRRRVRYRLLPGLW
ncbi:MAG: isoprenylcysteine carboxylmethyltransferase family protein [Candidatus Eremiobacteraeota bacterium]|nr:isoprenylcysteine carboxylmethyltransferase family protein [Candidatus Eremiobacteraeota bacterium]MCW5872516.1 isoprenylcysteine carboxylmethyltransferase family protein [Candidatus Eremiobacteraeota bacterium]